jgi:penicillin-binding protein 2
MSVFNQNRSRIIKTIFAATFIIIVLQIINLQFVSGIGKFGDQAYLRKVVYPNRGIVFDRKKRSLLENITIYDLLVTPALTKGIDTAAFCAMMNIDTATYRKRLIKVKNKTGNSVKQGIFESLLSPEIYARLSENMYRFPGFVLSQRSIRSYPYDAAGNILGYVREVDTSDLRRHEGEGYEMGDYIGKAGLEKYYEKILLGTRGVKIMLRDKLNREIGNFENGKYDTQAVAGKNLYSSLDIELQKLGEKLMTNKVGSIVAIDPKTGGILAMISAPTYNPNYLTGSNSRKHFGEMQIDPRLPLMNRAVQSTYSPGSTFKTVVGIIGLTEGVINDKFTVHCSGAFYGCGNGKPKCLDRGSFDFRRAVAVSDNNYFATVYKKILDQNRFVNYDSALDNFNSYTETFGLGRTLGVDLPSEKKGLIPSSQYIRKKLKTNKWYPCNIISNSIGQGFIDVTMTQLANVMAVIANKGYYYTPHVIDSIEGGDVDGVLTNFKIKNRVKEVPDTVFEIVQDGMQGVMQPGGTGYGARVEGINICGKTGTVENYAKGGKQKDHSFFGAFAPRENPKIAIAVICENAGFGSQTAAPIASLMIEKYLNDTISEKRKKVEEDMTNKKCIPKLMQEAIDLMEAAKKHRLDSINGLIEINSEKDDTTLIAKASEEKNIQYIDIDSLPQKPIKKDSTRKVIDTNAIIDNKKREKKIVKNT